MIGSTTTFSNISVKVPCEILNENHQNNNNKEEELKGELADKPDG